MALALADRGIRVNAVAPTWTRTAFIGQLEAQPELMARIRAVTPLGRLAEPQEVAAAPEVAPDLEAACALLLGEAA